MFLLLLVEEREFRACCFLLLLSLLFVLEVRLKPRERGSGLAFLNATDICQRSYFQLALRTVAFSAGLKFRVEYYQRCCDCHEAFTMVAALSVAEATEAFYGFRGQCFPIGKS